MFYVLEALFHAGRYQQAVEIIRGRWGEMLKNGATTFWEIFGNWRLSRSHGWSSGPAMLLSAEILGVQPIAPGFRVFQIQPHPVDLTWAKGVVPTPQGDISVAWQEIEGKRNETFFKLKVYVPEGTTGEILLPGLANAYLTVSLHDLVFWSRGKASMKPRGVKKVQRENNNLRVTLEGAGEYQFEVMQLTTMTLEGYDGTRWKMSPEEVRQVFPEKEFSSLQHPWMGPGSTAQDKLIDYFSFKDRIVDENARVNFYFFQNQLFKVEIDLSRGDKEDYEALRSLLKTEYGEPPLGEQTRPDNSIIVRWKDENSNVLQLSFNGGRSILLGSVLFVAPSVWHLESEYQSHYHTREIELPFSPTS